MALLLLGLGLWYAVHLIPSLAGGFRTRIVDALGVWIYKILFSLALVAAIMLMSRGWQSMIPAQIYTPPAWGRGVTAVLVLLAFYLFAVGRSKSNIKRILRHPQLTAVLLWSTGHLFANGDSRSLILFPVLFIWALVEMYFINRRQGAWQKPEPVSAGMEVLTAVMGIVLFAVLVYAHPYLSGIPLIPN